MKRTFVAFALIAAVFSPAFAMRETLELIDSPTATTLGRGFISVDAHVYNNGGLFMRTLIGMTDNFTLGLSESIDRAISDSRAQFHIPGVFAKLRLLYGGPRKFHLALGYGQHTFSEIGYQSGTPVQGVYAVGRKGFSLFSPSHYIFLNFGVRLPILPNEYRKLYRVSLFGGIDTTIGNDVHLKFEVANIAFVTEERIHISAGIAYHFTETFMAEFDFQYMPLGDNKHYYNRMIKIAYTSIFY